jgi:hypothetical protein
MEEGLAAREYVCESTITFRSREPLVAPRSGHPPAEDTPSQPIVGSGAANRSDCR